jgi:predicted Zn-dependent protease
MLTMARERISDNPLPREPAYYGAMYARYLIDTESWGEADKWLAPDGVHVPTPHYYFAQAYAAAQLGHLDEARDLLPRIQVGGKESNPEIILSQMEVDILKLEVQSVIALKEGDGERAVTMAREAAEMQASLPFRYGPPRISKPTMELLGDILYELGNSAGAILAYQDQLSRSKLRTNSLIGLARATAKIGDDTTSLEAYGELANIWHSADESVTGLAEVKRLTQRN